LSLAELKRTAEIESTPPVHRPAARFAHAMIGVVSDPADLGVRDAAAALAGRSLSSRELVEACLARIRERDGTHSFDGDPTSINAWVRVYEEDALTAADRADEALARAREDAPRLCGIPIGLKDLYAASGKPLTASSRLLDEVPARDCDAWARLKAQGMVLLGHVHTHEFGAGGTTDQVGNPWRPELSPGGSGGGSAAALAARMVAATTGTDTAGSERIPSAMCGTSAIKPTIGLVSMRGIVPLGTTLDHAGPMTRTVADCEPLLASMSGVVPPASPRPLLRYATSPRIADLDPDVAEGFEAALQALPGEHVDLEPPETALDLRLDLLDVVCSEMLVYHRRFDDRRELYRPSIRGFLEYGENRAMTADEYVAAQTRRSETTYAWADWFEEHRIDAIVEPTVPIVAHERGAGYDEAFTDVAEISLTHYWDWTGFPVVALPSGVGRRSGLPVSVSLIGAPGADWDLLAWGTALQAELGEVSPP
jgi:aspartyl-tRNA(Asn)/glutamyl-tRNA(Gln) amidotransferase subunit A